MKHNNLSSRPTRKLIYVPSEELWESVKKAAKEDGRSASNYLIQLHKVNIGIVGSRCATGEPFEPSIEENKEII